MSLNHVIKNSEAIISIELEDLFFGSAISLAGPKPMIVAIPGGLIWLKKYNLEYPK